MFRLYWKGYEEGGKWLKLDQAREKATMDAIEADYRFAYGAFGTFKVENDKDVLDGYNTE